MSQIIKTLKNFKNEMEYIKHEGLTLYTKTFYKKRMREIFYYTNPLRTSCNKDIFDLVEEIEGMIFDLAL